MRSCILIMLLSAAVVLPLSAAEVKGAKPQQKAAVTFVELGSVNCIPCKAMQPVMKAIESKYKGKVRVVFYDVWTDQGAPYAKSYNIRAIPTQVFLDADGNEFFRHTGYYPEADIDAVLLARGIKP